MVQAQVEKHVSTSERFLEHASEEYLKGDLPQASEKAWGAVAHYLKSVAKSRDWPNSSHGDLDEVAGDLAYETDDVARAMRLYRSVSDLHRNFYEDRMPDEMVGGAIEDAVELLATLKNRTGQPIYPRPSQARRPILR